jgi:hypothetical protein
MNSTIMAWGIFFILVFATILYFRLKKIKDDKLDFNLLQNYASEFNTKISFYDHWNNNYIGISSEQTKKLYYIKKNSQLEMRETVDLDKVTNCKIVKEARHFKHDDESIDAVDKINLVFMLSDATKPMVSLEFYNSDYDHLTLVKELGLANKWLGIAKANSNSNQLKTKH